MDQKPKNKFVETLSSDDESDKDGLGTVEEIMGNGGRKKKTIASEAMYVKRKLFHSMNIQN